MSTVVLLQMRKLLECLVAVVALVLSDVVVHEHVLCELLGRRERLEAFLALVSLLLDMMDLDGMTLHAGTGWKLLGTKRNILLEGCHVSVIASQITGYSINCLTACSGLLKRKHQRCALPGLCKGSPVDSPHTVTVTWKRVFMSISVTASSYILGYDSSHSMCPWFCFIFFS